METQHWRAILLCSPTRPATHLPPLNSARVWNSNHFLTSPCLSSPSVCHSRGRGTRGRLSRSPLLCAGCRKWATTTEEGAWGRMTSASQPHTHLRNTCLAECRRGLLIKAGEVVQSGSSLADFSSLPACRVVLQNHGITTASKLRDTDSQTGLYITTITQIKCTLPPSTRRNKFRVIEPNQAWSAAQNHHPHQLPPSIP